MGAGRDRETPPWLAETRCWEIEGKRGQYKQNLVKNDNPLIPDAIWMELEGYHFKECVCLRGEAGKEPDRCKWRRCNPWEIGGTGAQCPPTKVWAITPNSSDGEKEYYFEQITKCTPRHVCDTTSNEYTPTTATCEDRARCCFKTRIRVDQDTFTPPEPCANPDEETSVISHSGQCSDYVIKALRLLGTKADRRCNMTVNCLETPAEQNDNEDINCDWTFFEGEVQDPPGS